MASDFQSNRRRSKTAGAIQRDERTLSSDLSPTDICPVAEICHLGELCQHLSPAALDGAIRLLEADDFGSARGEIVETGDREIAKSNSV